ncbi:MAG: Hsp20 family protein [Rhodobacteraceae bacterium]|nr:Hsp20 family protein [Paracoccaceae bacterium]
MSNSSFATHPNLLGFEQLDRLFESQLKNDGFPPYNIEQRGENRFRIVLAVAGFSDEDLSVTFVKGELLIKGKLHAPQSARTYLHRGIAARQFQKGFVLAKDVDVKHAYMEAGLLYIDLERAAPERRIQKIKINAG